MVAWAWFESACTSGNISLVDFPWRGAWLFDLRILVGELYRGHFVRWPEADREEDCYLGRRLAEAGDGHFVKRPEVSEESLDGGGSACTGRSSVADLVAAE